MSYLTPTYGRYAISGVLTFSVYLACGALLFRIWPQEAMVASAAFLVAVAFNYVMQQAWVFRGRVAVSTSMPRYAVMIMVGFALNAAVVHVLARQVPLTTAQVGAACTVIVANALISFAWVYARECRSHGL